MSLFSALSTMTCGTRERTRAVRNGLSLGPGRSMGASGSLEPNARGEYSNSTHRDPLRVLGADALGLGLALVCDG
jgi:hypothetical protein